MRLHEVHIYIISVSINRMLISQLRAQYWKVIRVASFFFKCRLKIIMVSGTMSENFRSTMKIVPVARI